MNTEKERRKVEREENHHPDEASGHRLKTAKSHIHCNK